MNTYICVVIITVCLSFSPYSAHADENFILAKVGGVNITSNDFMSELNNLPEYLKTMADTPQGRKEMLDTMVTCEMILQEARKEGIDKDPAISRKLQDLKNRLIVESYLKKKVESKVNVTEEELKSFYEKNKNKFMGHNQIRASHILVKDEVMAFGIAAQAKAGVSFENLASKYSIDSSASKGGDLGWFEKGTMVPAFEEAALALEVNQISNVVKTDFGYHIIKLIDKQSTRLKPFTEVREQINAAILPTKQKILFGEIKEKLKTKIKHTINDSAVEKLDIQVKKDQP